MESFALFGLYLLLACSDLYQTASSLSSRFGKQTRLAKQLNPAPALVAGCRIPRTCSIKALLDPQEPYDQFIDGRSDAM